MSHTIINFYKFVHLDDPQGLRDGWKALGHRLGLVGTILIATEGVNAALSGERDALDAFTAEVHRDPRFADVVVKSSVGETEPFHKLVVKVKRWIIRFAEAADPDVDAIGTGRRIGPEALRDLLRDRPDDVVVVDTRNDYEFAYGTFRGARTLPIRRFTEFPEVFNATFGHERDKTYVFFCTGGVRCEKVVPWAESQGFKHSYQLDGGILAYFKDVGGEAYEGDCFVFDERWLLQPELKERPGRARPGHFPKRPRSLAE